MGIPGGNRHGLGETSGYPDRLIAVRFTPGNHPAVAAVEILKTLPLKMEGLDVCVIGHSEIVGKPIAFLMMGLGATVTVCHHMTRQVAVHSRAADAVFDAVGKPGLVWGEMLKPTSPVARTWRAGSLRFRAVSAR